MTSISTLKTSRANPETIISVDAGAGIPEQPVADLHVARQMRPVGDIGVDPHDVIARRIPAEASIAATLAKQSSVCASADWGMLSSSSVIDNCPEQIINRCPGGTSTPWL
jgi:hypothetical protein